jgi:hypothetical protein
MTVNFVLIDAVAFAASRRSFSMTGVDTQSLQSSAYETAPANGFGKCVAQAVCKMTVAVAPFRLQFIHQLTADLPCRAPAPLRIAFAGLYTPRSRVCRSHCFVSPVAPLRFALSPPVL